MLEQAEFHFLFNGKYFRVLCKGMFVHHGTMIAKYHWCKRWIA